MPPLCRRPERICDAVDDAAMPGAQAGPAIEQAMTLTDHVWSTEDVVRILEEVEAPQRAA
jgi:hypothetical protein